MSDLLPDPDTDRIRETAARWLARLERTSSNDVQRDLKAWLDEDPRHARAYARIARRFEEAQVLRRSRRFADRPSPKPWRHRVTLIGTALALATSAIFLSPAIRLPWASEGRDAPPLIADDASAKVRSFKTLPGTLRAVGLEDGSVVTLDGASEIRTSFMPRARRVTLVHGRARFDVAHDGRTFAVIAHGQTVTARGTVFDVSIASDGRVAVVLLQGSVDVAPSRSSLKAGIASSTVRRLRPGQTATITRDEGVTIQPTDKVGPWWTRDTTDFDDVTLGYVVDLANRTEGPPIRIDEPSIRSLRVSGRFDLRDADRLTANLARLLDLRHRRDADGIVLSMK